MPEGVSEDKSELDGHDLSLTALEREMEGLAVDGGDEVIPSGTAAPPQSICGAPTGWNLPCAPPDWTPAAPRTRSGQPDIPFDQINNPGEWSEFSFRPKFKKTGQCMCHALPVGVTPVPARRADGKRIPKQMKCTKAGVATHPLPDAKECKFFCQDWKNETDTEF